MSAKTGEIDMSKIHQYLLKDDIFKRATVVPNGKNHGVIMLVDWSGSMYDAIRETYEQSIVLAMFCRRVGIPHRVFAFTDAYRGYTEAEEKLTELQKVSTSSVVSNFLNCSLTK